MALDIGANPSAEEADEGVEDTKQTVIDVVHSFRLNETSFDKKSYLTHLKGASEYSSSRPARLANHKQVT